MDANNLTGTSEKQLAINAQVRELIDRKLDNNFSEDEKALLRQYRGGGGSEAKTAQETLFEFYTPLWLTEKVWELLRHFGYDGGYVLEPSCATGNFFAHADDESKCIGFEMNKYTARIAQVLYPKATIYNRPFEYAFLKNRSMIRKVPYTWLEQYPFSAIVGNPPFGLYKSIESSFFMGKKIMGRNFKPTQFESMFLYLGLNMLKKGGLLVYVLPQAFLRNGDKYSAEKKIMGDMAEVLEAIRMPPIFHASGVPTDLLILKRK